MHPPTKDQANGIGADEPTIDCAVDMYTGAELADMARQEFKNDADINYMLSRFGVTQPRTAPIYGEWDDSIDLQSALQAVHDAREGFKTLPKEMKEKFHKMEDLLEAYNNGSLVIRNEKAPENPTPTIDPKTTTP